MIRPQMTLKRIENIQGYFTKGRQDYYYRVVDGKITDVKDTTLTVEIADKVLVRIDKSAVLKDNSNCLAHRNNTFHPFNLKPEIYIGSQKEHPTDKSGRSLLQGKAPEEEGKQNIHD